MKTALIGYTGFVGSNLLAQHPFTHLYNSKNIGQIEGESFDLVVCAGVQAKKWLANKEPDWDWQGITDLMARLDTVQAHRFVLVSTIDVYPNPLHVDEDTVIDLAQTHPYGKHRLQLEQWVAERFANHYIVRLPALFGNGLKKNALYDLLHSQRLDLINPQAQYQFYYLEYLWQDIQKALAENTAVLNITSAPLSMGAIASYLGIALTSQQTPAASYDCRSKYAIMWGHSQYQYSREEVLADLRTYITIHHLQTQQS